MYTGLYYFEVAWLCLLGFKTKLNVFVLLLDFVWAEQVMLPADGFEGDQIILSFFPMVKPGTRLQMSQLTSASPQYYRTVSGGEGCSSRC